MVSKKLIIKINNRTKSAFERLMVILILISILIMVALFNI